MLDDINNKWLPLKAFNKQIIQTMPQKLPVFTFFCMKVIFILTLNISKKSLMMPNKTRTNIFVQKIFIKITNVMKMLRKAKCYEKRSF